MSNLIYIPQPPEIIAALMAAGCGIIRRPQKPQEAPPAAADAEQEPTYPKGFPITLERILRAVARETKVPYREIVSERRFVPATRARAIYYAAARELTGRSLPSIGKACHGRDHSTVLHGVQKVAKNREAFEPELSRVIAYLSGRKA
jgi:chromosomal replication initiation ATPase DnaA